MNKGKSLILLFVIILLLTACGNKAYKEALEKGYNALSEQKYGDAYEHFKKALQEKDTDEALKGRKTAETMIDGWNAYDDGKWNDAIKLASKILEDDPEEQSIKTVTDDAEVLYHKANDMKQVEEQLTAELKEIEQLIKLESYEEAKERIKKLLDRELTHEKLASYQEKAEDLFEITEFKMKGKEEQNIVGKQTKEQESKEEKNKGRNKQKTNHQQPHKPKKEKQNTKQKQEKEKGKEDKKKEQEEAKNPISKEEAENLIRKELEIPDYVYVTYSHEQDDDYIIQVYEISGDDEIKHTATWGWYAVNKYTGKWSDAF